MVGLHIEDPDTSSQYASATSSSDAVEFISCGYGLDFNILPKAADNTEGKINPFNLLEIFQLLVFRCDAGRECCVIHTQSGKTSLILKQLTATSPLSARWLTSGKIYEIPYHPDSQYSRKDFSGKGRSGMSRQLLCPFTSLKNDVKELTSSLLLLRVKGHRGTRLSLRN